jgi:hypothetical protein
MRRLVLVGALWLSFINPAFGFSVVEHKEIARRVIADVCVKNKERPSQVGYALCGASPLVTLLDREDLDFVEASSHVAWVSDDPHELLTGRSLELGDLSSSLHNWSVYAHESDKHYYPSARQEYLRWHSAAVQLAAVATTEQGKNSALSWKMAKQAVLFEAFAIHFLMDLFATDHADIPRPGVHLAVLARNRSGVADGGLDASDGNWYFGDRHLGKSNVQREAVTAAVRDSLQEVVWPDPKGEQSKAEIHIPYFGWSKASVDEVFGRRHSEYLAFTASMRGAGSGVRYTDWGFRLDVWLMRYLSVALGGYFLAREDTFSGFEPNVGLSVKSPLMVGTVSGRLPVLSRPTRDFGLNLDLVAELSFACETSERVKFHGIPEAGGGLDLFLHVGSHSTWSLVYGARAGSGHLPDGTYAFQFTMNLGVAY